MALPDNYERSIGITQSLRPKDAIRMIVERRLLKIPFYKIEMISNSFGNPNKKVNHVEIHPIEWDSLVVFAALKTKIPPVGIPIKNITDVSIISEAKGLFRKKDDLMLKITFVDNDNSERWLVMNMEDEYIQEFHDRVGALKQKESDELYWTRRGLISQDSLGVTRTVNIYPLTPFLAEGEEIIWRNILLEPKSKDKIEAVQVVTNYRVLLYNYEQHVGTVILLPSIEDITVTNITHTKQKPVGTYIKSSPFSSIENLNKDTIGDVVFNFGGRSFLTFSQISEPGKLASTVRLMIQNTNMQVIEPPQLQSEQESIPQSTISPEVSEKNDDLECKECGWANPIDSKFCNRCGSSLSTVCPNCSFKNPSDASFCNECGTKISKVNA
jgi:ribosomal protein L40E